MSPILFCWSWQQFYIRMLETLQGNSFNPKQDTILLENWILKGLKLEHHFLEVSLGDHISSNKN